MRSTRGGGIEQLLTDKTRLSRQGTVIRMRTIGSIYLSGWLLLIVMTSEMNIDSIINKI
jgi:hypothetical protein